MKIVKLLIYLFLAWAFSAEGKIDVSIYIGLIVTDIYFGGKLFEFKPNRKKE